MSSAAERLERLRQHVLAADGRPCDQALAEIAALFEEVRRLDEGSGVLAQAQADALVNSAMIVTELETAKARLEQEVSRRKQAEATIRAVVEGTARGTGNDFFRLLTQHLAQALGMQYALVGKVMLPQRDRIQVLANWADDAQGSTFEYDLAGTPCANACRGELCFYGDHVQEQFPDDALLRELGVRSYIGTPLWDTSGTTTLGVIAVLGKEPLADAELAGPILEVFAMRAAAELERALFESEMRAARETAEMASRAKSRFLAKMSHEIRTPLNGVLGTADLLSTTGLDAQQDELVEIMRDAGTLLLDIVNDVLDLSKIEAGKLQIRSESFEIREQVQSVVQLLRPRAEEKGLELGLTIASEVPVAVRGDPMRVRQIVTNLAGNAVRYTENGRVDVAVSVVSEPDASRIRFEVRDTGPGIPEDQLELIFGSFEQVQSTASSAGGTGLGLSIARQLAEAMGGAVGVESELGRGSTFWATVSMPHVVDEEPQGVEDGDDGDARATSAVRHRPGLRVLVAEDNRVNQLVAARMLDQLGCAVEIVTDGEAAVDGVREGEFDIVFMDSQMPKLDGLAATRLIRSKRSAAELPIISLTANAFEEHRDACIAVGMNDILNKPVRIADIRGILAKWCPGCVARV